MNVYVCVTIKIFTLSKALRYYDCSNIMYILTHNHTYIYIHTYIHSFIHTHIYIHSFTHIYTCIQTYIHIYIHSFIHTHTYIHTHIHKYTPSIHINSPSARTRMEFFATLAAGKFTSAITSSSPCPI